MSLDLPADLTASLQHFIASAGYPNEVEVIRDALAALEFKANVDAIQKGVDELQAGLGRPWEQIDAEIRAKFHFGNP